VPGCLPATLVLNGLNLVISLALISAMFAAIYKVLPDKPLEWRDVIVGAIGTAVLFNLGKYLVGFYIGHSSVSSSYGPAGALIVVLLWIYYSSEIFCWARSSPRSMPLTSAVSAYNSRVSPRRLQRQLPGRVHWSPRGHC